MATWRPLKAYKVTSDHGPQFQTRRSLVLNLFSPAVVRAPTTGSEESDVIGGRLLTNFTPYSRIISITPGFGTLGLVSAGTRSPKIALPKVR